MNLLQELINKDNLEEITFFLKFIYRNKLEFNQNILLNTIDTGGCNILNGIIGLLTNNEELILLGAIQDENNEVKKII